MDLAKLLRRLSGICFLLMWIPFALVMINGPLSMMRGNHEDLQSAADVITSPWFYAMWVLFAGTFVFLIASTIAAGVSNRRIIANGQDAEAKILAINDTGTRINDNPVIEVSLQIQPENYPVFVATARQTVSVIHLPSYQPGKFVRVKYISGTDKVAITGVKID